MTQVTIDQELLPCPFCGSTEPKLEDHRLMWSVSCSCGVTILGDRAPEPNVDMPAEYWKQLEDSAINRWNLRAALQAEPAQPVNQVLVDALKACRDRFFPANQSENDRDEQWTQVNTALAQAQAQPAQGLTDEDCTRIYNEAI